MCIRDSPPTCPFITTNPTPPERAEQLIACADYDDECRDCIDIARLFNVGLSGSDLLFGAFNGFGATPHQTRQVQYCECCN